MLMAVGVAVVARDARVAAVAGVLALGMRFVRARGWRTPAGTPALANAVTSLRLVVVASLPVLSAHLPGTAIAGIVFGLLLVDGVDGYLARTRGEASAFGADYDMETDALCVIVVALLLHERGLGAWVLIAGLWRYAFAAAVALAPALGDCPPSPIYRWLFTSLMVAFAIAWLPIGSLASASAAIGTALVSLSFAHSIVRSRLFTAPAPREGRPSSNDRT
jgi:phosphatidylglycerophosphate synthase